MENNSRRYNNCKEEFVSLLNRMAGEFPETLTDEQRNSLAVSFFNILDSLERNKGNAMLTIGKFGMALFEVYGLDSRLKVLLAEKLLEILANNYSSFYQEQIREILLTLIDTASNFLLESRLLRTLSQEDLSKLPYPGYIPVHILEIARVLSYGDEECRDEINEIIAGMKTAG